MVWQEQAAVEGLSEVTVLDPAQRLIDGVLTRRQGECKDQNITVEAVSRIDISEKSIANVARVIEATSPEAARAARNYQVIPDLFTWES
jgi:hypothetical protein